MGAHISQDRIQVLVDIIGRYPAGATLDDIAGALDSRPDQRKLQRWLAMIVEGGGITEDNTGPVTRYHAVSTAAAAADTTAVASRSPGGNPPAIAVNAPSATLDAYHQARGDQPASLSAQGPAVSSGAADPETLAAAAVTQIVGAGMSTEGARTALQGMALANSLVGPAMVAFVDRVMPPLATLTPADAARIYGLSARQYALWREHCALAESGPSPLPPPSAPDAPDEVPEMSGDAPPPAPALRPDEVRHRATRATTTRTVGEPGLVRAPRLDKVPHDADGHAFVAPGDVTDVAGLATTAALTESASPAPAIPPDAAPRIHDVRSFLRWLWTTRNIPS